MHFLALRRLILGERASEIVRQGVRLGRRDECVEKVLNRFRIDEDPLFEIVSSGALAVVFLRVSNGRRLPRARVAETLAIPALLTERQVNLEVPM